jgi:beta-N-acetylhexosaminidase
MRIMARTRAVPALLSVLACSLLTSCSSFASSAPSPATGTSPVTSRSATASPARPSGPEAQVSAALAALDRRAQIAQLFVVGVPLADLTGGGALVERGVGGVFLAGRSQVATTELATTTAQWQSAAPGPALWIAVDQEGGQVQTLTGPGFDRLPSALEQGSLPHDQLATLATGLGTSLHDGGVNLDLAPVVDVVPAGAASGSNPIGAFQRQYGSTGPATLAAAATVADGLAASGVTPTLKHFPGLGRVQGNTDIEASVTDTVTTVGDEQVSAFSGTLARRSAHPFVMMSLATYAEIDPAAPAVFSAAVVTDLLRTRLGFDGVVISDDLGNARAVRDVPPGERATRFIAAGGTLVLTVTPSIVDEMIDAVAQRDATDHEFAAAVDSAVHTALLAKAEAGLLPPA